MPSKDSDLTLLPIFELAPLLKRRRLSPVELAEAALAKIEQGNPKLNAFITVTAERAREEARQAEREIQRGRYRGPLHGIPISLKDNIWTRGIRTTAGSRVLADFVPTEDATIVQKLRRAGAVLVGKTNLHEFAYGVTSNNAHYGPVRNPHDPERIPGGSSGGSAVAVQTGMCAASIGTDTGGSIRIPAALCGIVGLKPTYGRVSCHGVVPLSRSLDHVGPLTRTVTDAAIVLGAIAGHDAGDVTSARAAVADYPSALEKKLRGMRLGWPKEHFFDRLDGEVTKAVESARRTFEGIGAKVREVSLPLIAQSADPSAHIAFAEALHDHQAAGWYPARAADYSEELRKRLDAGTKVKATEYLAALEFQKLARAEFEAVLQDVDAMIAPTVPTAAPRIGEEIVTLGGEDETVRAALIRLNRPANLTGLPAISVPCGFTQSGLPIGLQLIGRAFDEAGLLRIAQAYERARA